MSGRKNVFDILQQSIKPTDHVIWMHVASLGEYEQGLPILEQLKKEYPNHKLLLTFFSPSGYEVKKDKTPADIVVYLPLDTMKNAKKFIALSHPALAIFIKYEIWPNYLQQLNKKKVPTLLVSALFLKRQVFFKPWGRFMRKCLAAFSHFFVQDENSQSLLKTIGFTNVTVSGDTRFDRVAQIVKRDNSVPTIEHFLKGQLCVVAGSTWPEDEALLTTYINMHKLPLKWIIAPHTIKESHISKLRAALPNETLLMSEIKNQDLTKYKVLIVDNVGLLTKIYSYANMAYVGGGFATGLHNTLEPAVFGIPVIIGPDYENFKEAAELVEKKGIMVIKSQDDLDSCIKKMADDSEFRKKTGKINATFIKEKLGATKEVLAFIKTYV